MALAVFDTSPHSIRYTASAPFPASKTRAQIAADCEPGPLKRHLESISDGAFADDPQLDLHVYTETTTLVSAGINANTFAGSLIVQPPPGGAFATGTVELVLRNSVGR